MELTNRELNLLKDRLNDIINNINTVLEIYKTGKTDIYKIVYPIKLCAQNVLDKLTVKTNNTINTIEL